MIIDALFAGFMAEWDTAINVVRIAGPGFPSAEICRELHRHLCEERTRRLAARGETSDLQAPFFHGDAPDDNPAGLPISQECLTRCLGRAIGASHVAPTKTCQT